MKPTKTTSTLSYGDQKRWVPERGFIVDLRRYIEKMENCPLFGSIAGRVETRQIIANLCEPHSEFFMEDFIHDLETDMGVLFPPMEYDHISRFLGRIRDELIEEIEGIYGQTDNIPVFSRWINNTDAIFSSREGSFLYPETSVESTKLDWRRLVSGSRLIQVFKRKKRSP